ncbi:MAG: hypothetical protein ABFS09_02665 [Thermodesulfobacteriota bacterium]
MRPSSLFFFVLFALAVTTVTLAAHGRHRALKEKDAYFVRDSLTRELGLTDLCLATEARYTRHPALSDDLAPFMDYPAALEHFPSGLFWAPK